MRKFSSQVLDWFAGNGRTDLPWQQQPTAYQIWVSEIMLQQTQVATVIPYYNRFMTAFPDLRSLAAAETDLVLHHWTGLGYYARARNLHKAAKIIETDYESMLPHSVEELCELPGIGRSTAGAIIALAYKQAAPILDGNVKRVLSRYHAIPGWPEHSAVKKQLWALAEALTPDTHTAEYTQAMMDLGAMICTRSKPQCPNCPLSVSCKAFKSGSIALYPGRKPKKTLPVKQVAMFILQNKDQEVLLQKRPPTGIWGSLWSFPEAETSAHQAKQFIPGIKILSSSTLPAVRHTFSHYHLDITPVHELVSTKKNLLMDSGRWLWYPLHNPLKVGLATPVKAILEQLADQSINPH